MLRVFQSIKLITTILQGRRKTMYLILDGNIARDLETVVMSNAGDAKVMFNDFICRHISLCANLTDPAFQSDEEIIAASNRMAMRVLVTDVSTQDGSTLEIEVGDSPDINQEFVTAWIYVCFTLFTMVF